MGRVKSGGEKPRRTRRRATASSPGTNDAAYREHLERAKRASPAQLLMRAARLVNERGVARLRASGRPGVTVRHTALLPHIDLEGTRVTELARRMGVTKQAADQSVAEIEAMGMVRRTPDPSDGRARLVRFTAAGRRELLRGLGVLGEIESELAAAIGRARLARLHADLQALVDYLEQQRPA